MNILFYSFTIFTLLIILIAFFTYLLKKTPLTQLQQIFGVNLFLLILCFICDFSQLLLSNYISIDPIYFEYFSYIGLVFLPISLFFTSLIFIHTKIKFKAKYLTLFIVPMISLLTLWTNNAHHLFYKVYSINLAECVYGPFFLLYQTYSYILYLCAVLLLINHFSKNQSFFSKSTNLIITGVLFPLIINIFGILEIIALSRFITTISLAIAIICLSLALLKDQLIYSLPISLEKVVNRISDAYLVLNDKNIIADYNKPFFDIFNISNFDLKTMHIFDLISLENFNGIDEDMIIKALRAVTNSDETLTFELEFPNISKFLRLEINSLKSDNIFIGALILIKDQTQHFLDLQNIQDKQSMLIEKERLASLGQMISGIAHNLKTPIFSITGASEGLQDLITEYSKSITNPAVTSNDHLEISKKMQDWVSKIKNYTTYMSDVITAVRGQALTFNDNYTETFTVEELINRVSILMKHELQQALVTLNISLLVDKDLEINGNITSLVQVINNLISNSIQSYNDQKNNVIEFSVYKENQTLVLAIQDFGAGIRPDVQEKLLKEMITTKGKKGTGLGLYMSASNIKVQFSGDIEFSSEEGKGTTFKVLIPIK